MELSPEDQKYFDAYNTSLTPQEEGQFQAWLSQESSKRGRDLSMDMIDYDVKGSWKSGDYKNVDGRGHGTDKWKKPSHPTFSDQSVYHGADGNEGGKWVEEGGKYSFTPGNGKIWSPAALQLYDKVAEPDVELRTNNPDQAYSAAWSEANKQ